MADAAEGLAQHEYTLVLAEVLGDTETNDVAKIASHMPPELQALPLTAVFLPQGHARRSGEDAMVARKIPCYRCAFLFRPGSAFRATIGKRKAREKI